MDASAVASMFSGEDGEVAAQDYLRREGLWEELSRGHGDENRYPPHATDLARLHSAIRRRGVITVLEFGVGYSTLVMSDALKKNREDWQRSNPKKVIRSKTPFQLFSVDASEVWVGRTKAMLPARLKEDVSIFVSGAVVGTFHDRMCHYYERLPDIVPDFIYLDGPHPENVTGNIGGLSWACKDRVVMSGDILRMEPALLPGTMVLVDGRTSNARFVASHLYREWAFASDDRSDVTVLELIEPPLRGGGSFLPKKN